MDINKKLLDAVHYYFYVDTSGSDVDGLDNVIIDFKNKVSKKTIKLLNNIEDDFGALENPMFSAIPNIDKKIKATENKDYKKLSNYLSSQVKS